MIDAVNDEGGNSGQKGDKCEDSWNGVLGDAAGISSGDVGG